MPAINGKNAFNWRKFASVTMAFSLVVLIVWAVVIKFSNISSQEWHGTLATTVHILSAYLIMGCAAIHLVMNRKAIKSYLTPKKIESTEEKKPFNARKLLFIAFAISIVITISMGFAIEYGEDFGTLFQEQLFSVIHGVNGWVCAILMSLHLKNNWKALTSYITPKKAFMSKEVLWGLCLSAIPIISGIILVIWNPKT